MSKTIYSWEVANSSTGRVSFDDQSLSPTERVTVNALTNDILAGWRQGKLHITPDPNPKATFAEVVGLDPSQFPIPVRIIGTALERTVPTIAEGGEVTVPMAESTRIVNADMRRIVLRVRNTGNQTLWLGGVNVTNATSLIPVAPGEVYTERDVPSSAMWAYVASNLDNEATTIRTQHVYAGTV